MNADDYTYVGQVARVFNDDESTLMQFIEMIGEVLAMAKGNGVADGGLIQITVSKATLEEVYEALKARHAN